MKTTINATIEMVTNATLNMTSNATTPDLNTADEEDNVRSLMIVVWMIVASLIGFCLCLCAGVCLWHSVVPEKYKTGNLFVKPGGMDQHTKVDCADEDQPPEIVRTVSSDRALNRQSFSLNFANQTEHLGVKSSYILKEFKSEVMHAISEGVSEEDFSKKLVSEEDYQDPNFHTIAKHLFYGEKGKGFGMTCPRDGRKGCSFVDALPPEHRGFANYFVSWVWSYNLSTFTGAIELWTQQTGFSPDDVILWVCAFCNNQYRIMEEKSGRGSDLLEVFEKRLNAIGSCVAILDTWQTPIYTKRVWCIFEQYTAVKNDIPVQIILPVSEAASMHDALETGVAEVAFALQNIDVESAEASFKADEEKVKGAIRTDVGFDRVNEAVQESLSQWFQIEFKNYIKKKAMSRSSPSTALTDVEDTQDLEASGDDRILRKAPTQDSIAEHEMPADCVICLVAAPTHIMVPCGHKAICGGCAKANKVKACPLCRKRVSQIIKVYG